jgi:hypothetical protein
MMKCRAMARAHVHILVLPREFKAEYYIICYGTLERFETEHGD